MHDPEHAEAAADARRMGGLRRRREHTVSGVYEFEGLETVEQIRRLLHIAAVDALGLDNSVARSRTLAYLAQVALKALEVGDLESRIVAMELVVGPRLPAQQAAKRPGRRGWWRG